MFCCFQPQRVLFIMALLLLSLLYTVPTLASAIELCFLACPGLANDADTPFHSRIYFSDGRRGANSKQAIIIGTLCVYITQRMGKEILCLPSHSFRRFLFLTDLVLDCLCAVTCDVPALVLPALLVPLLCVSSATQRLGDDWRLRYALAAASSGPCTYVCAYV